MKHGLTFLLFVLLFSCTHDYGNRVEGGKLNVFYTADADSSNAKKLAAFFRDNKLLTGKEQTIQLYRSKNSLEIRLIATDTSNLNRMPFEERKLLIDFQKQIESHLNANEPVSLIICDNQFKPLYRLDP